MAITRDNHKIAIRLLTERLTYVVSRVADLAAQAGDEQHRDPAIFSLDEEMISLVTSLNALGADVDVDELAGK